jgi:F-type H+-transporting ATPase subunit gamma
MQMVASSKMRKAQLAALAGRRFAVLMNQVIVGAGRSSQDFAHPLMEQRPVRKRAVLVVSTDKGLCGALNTNLAREAAKFDKENTVFVTAGRKGSQFVVRTKRKLAAEFTYKDIPTVAEAHAISNTLQQLFLKGEVDCVDVLFTRFVNTLTQKVDMRRLLPVGELKNLLIEAAGDPAAATEGATPQHLFEPSAEQVLSAVLPIYVDVVVYQVLLEAKASEHSSRMVAMKNATDNAMQLIKDLTLEYNKLRQANITKELLEITTAQMAMG